MSFDDKVNKILHEAYFNSPYEKATGIKRQVGLNENESDSEFSELQARRQHAIVLAADEVISTWEAAMEEGEPMSKKELAEFSLQKLAELEERQEGDEFLIPSIKDYFAMIGQYTTGKPPMTAERYRHLVQGAEMKLRDLMGGREANDGGDIETDPDAIAQARANLQQDLEAKRQSYTYR